MPSPDWLPTADVVMMDVLKPETLPKALEGVQVVVHFAALNEADCLKNPAKAVAVNVDGVAHVLDAAMQAGVQRFIYFSTAHVYGAPLIGHITERSTPRPVSVYAQTHFAAEEKVLAAHQRKAIEGIVIRLSNGFGSPAHSGVHCWRLLVNDLCTQAVCDKQLVLRSSGLQLRDFISIDDVGRVVEHLLGLPVEMCGDGLFNVGSGCSMSVYAMAGRIASCCHEVFGYAPKIIRPEPEVSDVVANFEYDISKIRQTGFLFNGDRDEEIKQLLRMCYAMHQRGQMLGMMNKKNVLFLMYHGITDQCLDPLCSLQMPREDFVWQMECLQRRFHILPLGETVDRMKRGAALPDHTAVITFDDGLANNYTVAYPVLKKDGHSGDYLFDDGVY